jgi:hypothetical protein
MWDSDVNDSIWQQPKFRFLMIGCLIVRNSHPTAMYIVLAVFRPKIAKLANFERAHKLAIETHFVTRGATPNLLDSLWLSCKWATLSFPRAGALSSSCLRNPRSVVSEAGPPVGRTQLQRTLRVTEANAVAHASGSGLQLKKHGFCRRKKLTVLSQRNSAASERHTRRLHRL